MGKPAISRTHPAPTLVTPAAGESLARPKVMRRPAQFSSATSQAAPSVMPVTEDFPAITSTAAPVSRAPTAPRAWQDDGRFALVLLAILIIINLAMAFWLRPAAPPAGGSEPRPGVEANRSIHVLDDDTTHAAH